MKISDGHPYHLHIGRSSVFCLANDHRKGSKLFFFQLVKKCSGSLFQNSQHQFLLIEIEWYLVPRMTKIFDMILFFFRDNFDVNFLHRLCVNRSMLALIITIIIYL